MLIFAPKATDPGRFEDYARKMYAAVQPPQPADLDHWPCIGRRATHRAPSRRAESVAGAGADPTVAACTIQSTARAACYEALLLTLWPIVAQDSENCTFGANHRSRYGKAIERQALKRSCGGGRARTSPEK
jgi:hypothetical protein